MAREAWDRLRAWLRPGGRGPSGDPLLALQDVGEVRRSLDQAELAAVRAARQAGCSWAEIATRLGVSRQSAWERWRELDRTGEAVAAASSELVEAAADRGRRRSTTRQVPNVVGLDVDGARLLLSGACLVAVAGDPDGAPLELAGRGAVVTDQAPEAGAKVEPDARIRLWWDNSGGGAGVREPRRPAPRTGSGREAREVEAS